ncbi:SPOR domain-containing protein [Rhodohalobacter sp. 614A]|uniref:SPOR domain-containing protein n=1 Tax=Rhodohalobacter sp. 614A TaxID=2908649 RepID=UPI001F258B7F|nr:SPOR domain-containing protein [Rhodohalobacter sp. 614A]
MKIDKNKLIDLLVEKTDMGRDEIKDQLDQLIERILGAAKRGKALEIKEFGLFYFDEEGELSFDPAEELSTEISFKYAGMKPVELKPERDTSIYKPEEFSEEPEAGEQEEQEEDDPFGSWLDEEDETEEAISATSEEDESEDPIDDSIYDPFASEAEESLEEPVEEEPKTKIEDIKPLAARHPVKKRRDNTGIFILLGIILAAVLIGAYFYYAAPQTQELDEQAESTTQMDSGMEQSESVQDDPLPQETGDENGEDATPDQQVVGENEDAAEQTGSDQVSEEEITTEPEVAVAETNQSLYGLTGSVVEEANNGYSIVLHSFTTEDRAMTAADMLREDGYRVIVSSRTVYENTVWRVSVGQFETLENAQQATTRLPSPYNTQNFIQRIRTN